MAQAILTRADHALVQLSRALSPLFRVLADLEHELVGERLAEVKIEAPVFVTGLARAGTTMMLTLLSQAAGVATHRYRDFPFLFVPLAWNWFQDRLGGAAGEAVERPGSAERARTNPRAKTRKRRGVILAESKSVP